MTPDNQIEQNATTREVPLTAREEGIELLKMVIVAVLMALAIRSVFLEPFNIPSGSMRPTLEIGDYLFVYKPAYGYSRFSFPFGMAPIEGRVWTRGHTPARGDVIVFKLPTNTSIDYIKRIVGLPGDTIQVKKGRLYINHNLIPREPIGVKSITENGLTETVTEYIETLPGEIRHHIYEISDDQPLDNTDEYTVPENHYFAMGDNRDNSQDSRVMTEVGYIPLENVVGRASFLFFSTNGTANMAEIWKWPWTIRYNRLLQRIGPETAAP